MLDLDSKASKGASCFGSYLFNTRMYFINNLIRHKKLRKERDSGLKEGKTVLLSQLKQVTFVTCSYII